MQRRHFLRLGLPACATTLLINGCGAKKTVAKPAKPQNLLFLGNSFTQFNNMPLLLQSLAAAAQQNVVTKQVTPGGCTLQQHAIYAVSTDAIDAQKWDYVVLQEQSTTPAIARLPQERMYPAIRRLDSRITAGGSRSLLFLTWGRERGFPEEGYRDYETMQQVVTASYLTIAAELNLAIAPVGVAWRTVVMEHPEIQLWDRDGSHPSLAGSFLAACVFYAALYRKSPQGVPYSATLEPKTAQVLQTVAGNTVVNNLAAWRL
jgi:hypothetical protein